MAKKQITTLLRKLTWDDVSDWAGDTIAERGRSYTDRVDRLVKTPEGGLAAWVTGSKVYATTVAVDEDGEPDSFCTCPYDWGLVCKHAVAVVLAGIEHLKRKKNFPRLDESEELYAALYEEIDDEDEDWDEQPIAPLSRPVPRAGTAKKSVRKALENASRDDLLDLVADLAGRHPEVARHLHETEQLKSGHVDKLVRNLRREIRELATEPAWYNPWEHTGNIPDYSHLDEQLQALLDKGHADAVLELGEELWTRGHTQVEQSDDEGETALQIAACLDTVLKALPRSSLAPADQLLWIVERSLEDEFDLLPPPEPFFRKKQYRRAHWQEVAAKLETRLKTMPKPRSQDFLDTYARRRLIDALLDVYKRAGQRDRMIPLLKQEAGRCGHYAALVDTLLAAGKREQARQWCIKGFKRTAARAPGTASGLRDRLREIARREQRPDRIAAYRAEEFFEHPSPQTYTNLRKAADKLNCWDAVRLHALKYLETGRPPARTNRGGKTPAWPLPPPEVAFPADRSRRFAGRFPDLDMLIDIAVLEKRNDDVVTLYRRLQKDKPRFHALETGETVARAVARSHPDVALEIWKKIADKLIAEVKPSAYVRAARYLRDMRKVYRDTGRTAEWQKLLDELRRKHKAKRRLMKVLDGLSNKKLIE